MTGFDTAKIPGTAGGTDQGVGSLIEVFTTMPSINAQGMDSRYAVGATVMAEMLQKPAGHEVFSEILEIRGQRKRETPLYVGELTLRALSEVAERHKSDLGWPGDFTDERPWRTLVHEIFDTQGDLLGPFFVRMCHSDIQSNVPGRAVFAALVLTLFRDRFRDDPEIADIGSSMNHTLNALMLPRNIFQDIEVVQGQTRRHEEQQLRRLLGHIATQRPHVSGGTGFDRLDMLDSDSKTWDSGQRLWVRVNTLRPDEQMDPEKVRIYDEIDAFTSDKIAFERADFALPLNLPFPVTGDKKYRYINLSAVLHQNQGEPSSVETILDNCQAIGEEGFVIGVLDFARPRPTHQNLRQFEFFQTWPAWSFRGSILDSLHPERGFQEIVRFSNGRCTKVRVGLNWSNVAPHAQGVAG